MIIKTGIKVAKKFMWDFDKPFLSPGVNFINILHAHFFVQESSFNAKL